MLDWIKSRKLPYTLIIIIAAADLVLIGYIFLLPLYPLIKYKYVFDNETTKQNAKDINQARTALENFKNNFLEAEYKVSPNRLIIEKIGVNAPIVDAQNADYGLSKGAWRDPNSSTPDRGGNTVITAHRFKYFPPNNLTFYLLDKLEPQDIISIIWEGRDYYFQIKETKIVASSDLSILGKTEKPVLTLYTCDPIYSTKNRLVVIADLVEQL